MTTGNNPHADPRVDLQGSGARTAKVLRCLGCCASFALLPSPSFAGCCGGVVDPPQTGVRLAHILWDAYLGRTSILRPALIGRGSHAHRSTCCVPRRHKTILCIGLMA
eukprot:CAMPEP_0114261374 /NCGR_PEP_ID=MMETSP0058-20121206/21089_1 /TAXON_ID=36894 /ORGANISM="Pyramimonas parkeae, CCMP726" /LENGTH=107 /DNA_ID=CAMNT_0001376877 /DNA_START=663 /DNA_END=986 /DNA_ORIENTATION=-